MNFSSDNTTGVAPQLLSAIAEASTDRAMPYGADAVTERMTARFRDVFEKPDLEVFPVMTGTAANALALWAMVPPFGAVLCHRGAHINTDECGAPEMFTGGAKLVGMPGDGGRYTADTLEETIAWCEPGIQHHVQPAAVSLTQATETGTVYDPDWVAAIARVAHAHGLTVHMDGARFANAVVSTGASPADLTWRAGVDMLAFGATKNGALAAEAVVVFDPANARDMVYRRKRAGHLASKMRFVSAQLDRILADGLWLDLARQSNAMASRLARGLADEAGLGILYPVQANEVFADMPGPVREAARAAGARFYDWTHGSVRLVTGFDTTAAEVDRFMGIVTQAMRAEGQGAAPAL